MKRSKRGMALASTMILLTIVLMLSTLMLSMTLYSSQMAALQAQNIDDRIVLDGIGQRFLDSKNDYPAFLSYYIENKGFAYCTATGGASEDETENIKGDIQGRSYIIKVEDADGNRTMTVVSAGRKRQLLRITCKLTTNPISGEKNATLKSWNYTNNRA